jgi:hypothetical protein
MKLQVRKVLEVFGEFFLRGLLGVVRKSRGPLICMSVLLKRSEEMFK